MSTIQQIPISKITVHPCNPRKVYEENSLKAMADTIRKVGVIQPVSLISNGETYQLIVGSRRLMAATLAQQETIPSIIWDIPHDDENALLSQIAIIENEQRVAVHPMEEARVYQMAYQAYDNIEDAARDMGVSVFQFRRMLKLNLLTEYFSNLFLKGGMTLEQAMIICQANAKEQAKYAKKMEKEDLSIYFLVREIKEEKGANALLPNLPLDMAFPEKKIPSCVGCEYNSHTAALFETDLTKAAVCSNAKCFNKKIPLLIDLHLKDLIDNPQVMFVKRQYSEVYEPVEEILKAHKIKITDIKDLHIFEKPDMPVLDEDAYDPDNYETEEDRLADYAEDVESYKKELEEYETRVAKKPEMTFVSVNKDNLFTTSTGILRSVEQGGKAKANANPETKDEIKLEIQRLNTVEKRKEELDAEKITKHIQECLQEKSTVYDCKDRNYWNTSNVLTGMEILAFYEALTSHLPYNVRNKVCVIVKDIFKEYNVDPKIFDKKDDLKYADYTEFPEVSATVLTKLVRLFLIYGMPNMSSYLRHEEAAFQYYMLGQYDQELHTKIIADQNFMKEKRKSRVEERISKLKSKAK